MHKVCWRRLQLLSDYPTFGPELIRVRVEISGVTLESVCVDACVCAFWDVATTFGNVSGQVTFEWKYRIYYGPIIFPFDGSGWYADRWEPVRTGGDKRRDSLLAK